MMQALRIEGYDMLPLAVQYSFTDFVRHWVAETGEDLGRVTKAVASEILEGTLLPQFHATGDWRTSQHKDFDEELIQHLRRVVLGMEPPDFDGRLSRIVLSSKNMEEWLHARGQGMSIVGKANEGAPDAPDIPSAPPGSAVGAAAYEHLQKVLAAVTLLLAETSPKYRNGNKPNATAIHREIEAILDQNPDLTDKLGKRGLSRSSVSAKISEALKLFGNGN